MKKEHREKIENIFKQNLPRSFFMDCVKELLDEIEKLEKNNKHRWYTVFELAKDIELPEVKYYILSFVGNTPPDIAIKDEHDIFIGPIGGFVYNTGDLKSIYPLPENK